MFLNKKEGQAVCPCCGNKRLFDVLPGTIGGISIKCSRCKKVILVSMKPGMIHTELLANTKK